MKVLFIGPYREQSGWGQASRDYIMSMHTVGIDVVCRPVLFGSPTAVLNPEITHCENKSNKDCNIVIQHMLPHLMDYNGNFEKNIGLYVTETKNLFLTPWVSKLNMMDELWIPNVDMMTDYGSKIKVEQHIIPHACDVSKYEKQYPKFNIEEIKDNYCFYYIGDLNRRKRISAMIRAFYTAFSRNQNVSLALKVSKHGLSPEQVQMEIDEICKKISHALKLYPNFEDYPQVICINNDMNDEEIMMLHETMDCFLIPSFGEAWCIPAFDALAMGNTVIGSNVGGLQEMSLCKPEGLNLIDGQYDQVMGMNETFFDVFTGRETWFHANINHMIELMKSAYVQYTGYNRFRSNTQEPQNLPKVRDLEFASNFSYEKVGQMIKERLEA